MRLKNQLPYYLINGRVYARVTRILSVVKDPEYAEDADQKKLDEAATTGTKVHKLIESDLKMESVKFPKKAENTILSCWTAYQEWKRSRCPHTPQTELTVWSDEHEVACTIDLLDWASAGYVTDFKTSAKLLRKHQLQVNANFRIYQEWAKSQAQKAGNPMRLPLRTRLVRLDKTLAMFDEQVREYSEDDWQLFLKIKDIYMDFKGKELLDAALEHIGGRQG